MHRVREPAVRLVAERQDGVVSAAQVRAAGMVPHEVTSRLRSGEWRRLYRATYLVDSDTYGAGLTPRTWWRSALLSQGPDAALTGPTAAALRGWEGAGDGEAIHLSLPVGRERHQPRVREGAPRMQLHVWAPRHRRGTVVAGLRCEDPRSSLADALCVLDRPAGLSVTDSALHQGGVTHADLADVERLVHHRPGAVHARAVLSLADGRAASPLESRVRLVCAEADLRPEALQWPVLDRHGVVLGYADMAYRCSSPRPFVVEADGVGVHSAPQALLHDRRRANDFSAAGCDIARFTWADVLRPAYVVSTVRRALAVSARPSR